MKHLLCIDIKRKKEVFMKMNVKYIKMEDLKKGYLYHIKARNAYVGIWIPEKQSFLISRWKFNENFLFEEYHWDTGEPYGTVKPLEDIENCPLVIPETTKTTDSAYEQMLLAYLNKKNEIYEQEKIRRTGRKPLYPHGRPAEDFNRKNKEYDLPTHKRRK
jgi:hypothetical protein